MHTFHNNKTKSNQGRKKNTASPFFYIEIMFISGQ